VVKGQEDVNEDTGQELSRLDEVADERYGWWNVRRARSYRRALLIGVAAAALIVSVAGLCWTVGLLDDLEVSCARDDRGKGTCMVYLEQALPPGCPPDCQNLDLQGVVLSGINLNWADFDGADLSRSELRRT
jgi:hypothetical protein